ncbi:MAG: cbb3-type cytochrome oxidase assembly protein CcoS [Pseudomonadota bacterium]
MNILVLLIPISLSLGGLGVAAFIWTLKSRQYDDPDGHAARILNDEEP